MVSDLPVFKNLSKLNRKSKKIDNITFLSLKTKKMSDFVIHRSQNYHYDPVASCLNSISDCIDSKNEALRRINAFIQLNPDFQFEREMIFAKNYIKEDKPHKAIEIITNIKNTLYG